jgi:hypothetical protein
VDYPTDLDDVFFDRCSIEPPDSVATIFSYRRRNILEPDDDPDFVFERKLRQRPAAPIFCPEYCFGDSIVHAFRP